MSLVMHEDNTALIACIRSGRNPTMRHVSRTHGVSVAWLHEVCASDHVELQYTQSADMAADIFTKNFSDATKWEHACSQIGIGVVSSLHADFLRHPVAASAGGPSLFPLSLIHI